MFTILRTTTPKLKENAKIFWQKGLCDPLDTGWHSFKTTTFPLVKTIFKREFLAYFNSPLAYVFLFVFLILANALTFSKGPYLGNFFIRGQADLLSFFMFHPWLFLFLIPAITMRLWAEERKTGTIELLLTLPIPPSYVVVGKFLAAWVFVAIALLLTFPLWITVNYLGHPDNGAILTGYIGSWLMAGGFIAIGLCLSALTKNQVIAFVLTATICFIFTVNGTSMVGGIFDWLPSSLGHFLASLSFMNHFHALERGVIEVNDLVFFFSLITLFLFANVVILSLRKGR